MLLAPLHRTHRHSHPLAEGPIGRVDVLQTKMITVGIGLPTLEHLEGSFCVFDALEIHDGIRSVVPKSAFDDPTVEAANALCADWVKQVFNVLVRIRHIWLGGVVAKSVDVVYNDPSGRVGLVCFARGEEVGCRAGMTRSGDLELVPTLGLEGGTFKSTVALVESAIRLHPGDLLATLHASSCASLLGCGVPRSKQSLFDMLGPVNLLGGMSGWGGRGDNMGSG